MDIETIKKTMQSFSTYPMCINCSKCDKECTASQLQYEYRCLANDNREIPHPRMHCNRWEPNSNMCILFNREDTPQTTAEPITPAQIELDNTLRQIRAHANHMHFLGAQYQKMHDDLKDEMLAYEKKIEPLESKEGALKALIYNNKEPHLLPYYQQQLDEISAQLDELYQDYDPMEARLKELYDKAQKYTYYVPTLPKEEKKAAVRPKTIQEAINEDYPSALDIFTFVNEDRIKEEVARQVRKAVAYMTSRREEREKNAARMRATRAKEAKAL